MFVQKPSVMLTVRHRLEGAVQSSGTVHCEYIPIAGCSVAPSPPPLLDPSIGGPLVEPGVDDVESSKPVSEPVPASVPPESPDDPVLDAPSPVSLTPLALVPGLTVIPVGAPNSLLGPSTVHAAATIAIEKALRHMPSIAARLSGRVKVQTPPRLGSPPEPVAVSCVRKQIGG